MRANSRDGVQIRYALCSAEIEKSFRAVISEAEKKAKISRAKYTSPHPIQNTFALRFLNALLHTDLRRFRMKGIVVYDTSYGNTKKIAETIAETLKEAEMEVEICYVKDVKKLNGKDYDFIVIGSPTKFGTMSLAIRFFLGKIKSQEWTNKPFAAFDTENPENIEQARLKNKEWSAAEKIAEKLKEKSMNQLAPVLKALVLGQKGPLVEGEIDKTKDYAKELATKLEGATFHS